MSVQGLRVVASIEARMGSSRLPGKVLADLGGRPALELLVTRLRRAAYVDDVVLATTVEASDDVLAEWAGAHGVACHRGSSDDVLARVVGAHAQMASDLIVEITGDCPFVDPDLVDWCVATWAANACDVVANNQTETFPNGCDVQVFRSADLAAVADRIDDPAVREHVSLYFYEHPDEYRILHLVAPPRWADGQLRLTLDYDADLEFLRAIEARLAPDRGDAFGIDDIMALLRAEPELRSINAHCEQKAVR